LHSASTSRAAYKKVRVGRSPSASHSMTRPPPRNEQGVTKKLVGKVKKIERSSQVPRQRQARKGEGDHHIGTKMPKHLFAGKRKAGKTDRR
jgi:nucleolar GTP-binding protein